MDEEEQFKRAMAQIGVRPLEERPETVVVRQSRRNKGAAVAPRRQHCGRFEIERIGERVEGLVEGAGRHQLDLLLRADLHIEVQLDLHGQTEENARRVVEEAVERAFAANHRCILVIHGRGRRSLGVPILKEALPDWLTGPRCAARVLAFTTAPQRLGGAGATLVLLRRRR